MLGRQYGGGRTQPPLYDDNPVDNNATLSRISSYPDSKNKFGTPQTDDSNSQDINEDSENQYTGAQTPSQAPAPAQNSPAASDEEPTVLSDADPEGWNPGAKYAQNFVRRGGGLQWRELSPLEGLRVMRYDGAYKALRELDPNNRQLTSMSTSTWIPTFADADVLNAEIGRIKVERRLSDLEPQHGFPLQFESRFRARDIEPEAFRTYLPRSFHRLRPDGLHANPINWNAQWDAYLENHPEAKPNELLEQLCNMRKQVFMVGQMSETFWLLRPPRNQHRAVEASDTKF